MSKARDLANAGTALTTVSATELGYLDGVTSAVQTQIDSKEATLPSQTGNSGKYLTTDGSAKSWGTIAAGSITLLSTTTLSGSTTTINSISQSYKQLQIHLIGLYGSVDQAAMRIQVNSDTTGKYTYSGYKSFGAGGAFNADNDNYFNLAEVMSTSTDPDNKLGGIINFVNYTSTGSKIGNLTTVGYTNNAGGGGYALGLQYSGASAISSITFTLGTGTFSGGSILIYGVN